jgi:hypothetical protein
MTARITASKAGLKPHYKVRVVVPGVILHLASWDEPHREYSRAVIPTPVDSVWHADWIDDPDYGDTIGFIDWDSVAAITWRYAGTKPDEPTNLPNLKRRVTNSDWGV